MRDEMKKKILKVLPVLVLLTTRCLYGQDLAATTSLISSVINDIAKGRIETATLVPPGSCPGHFDLKTNDLKTIEKTGILLAHGYEEYLGQITGSVKNPHFAPVIIGIEDNWLVPDVQKQVYREISTILSDRFPQYGILFAKNIKKAEEEINRTDREIKKLAAEKNIRGIPVICNDHIKEILEYIGFDVVATYGRKEELTPSSIKNLMAVSRARNVRVVIDNLQAGLDTGKIFSDELGISHLAISNFPGVFPGTPTLRQTLYENAKRIITVYENSKNPAD